MKRDYFNSKEYLILKNIIEFVLSFLVKIVLDFNKNFQRKYIKI
jgi:hypothetical protein